MSHPSRSLMAQFAAAAALASTLVLAAGSAHAGTQVGVSINVNQPGFYGRVDIGQQQPVLVYQQPVVVHQSVYSTRQRPIYMRVPPGHYKQWSRYCGQYSACNQPVYFVNDKRGARPTQMHPGHRHDDRRGRPQDNRRHDGGHGGKGHGNGNGNGHGHGHR